MSGPLSPATPLFRLDRFLDPGWPFVLAGLALLVAGILIPAQRELHDLRNELRKVEAAESRMFGRLEAYDRFLSDLRHGDPLLIRRLASAQLNRVPEGEAPLLLTPGMNQTVAQWIDESVPVQRVVPEPYPDTLLGRIALGPNRLWLLASSVFLLFVGLMLAPDAATRHRQRDRRGEVVTDDRPMSSAHHYSGQTSARTHEDGGQTCALLEDSGQTSAPFPEDSGQTSAPFPVATDTYGSFWPSRRLARACPTEDPPSDDQLCSPESDQSAAPSVLVVDDTVAPEAEDEVIDVELVGEDECVVANPMTDSVGLEPGASPEAQSSIDWPGSPPDAEGEFDRPSDETHAETWADLTDAPDDGSMRRPPSAAD